MCLVPGRSTDRNQPLCAFINTPAGNGLGWVRRGPTELVSGGEGGGQPVVLDHRAAPLGVAHGAHVGHAQGVAGGGSAQVLRGQRHRGCTVMTPLTCPHRSRSLSLALSLSLSVCLALSLSLRSWLLIERRRTESVAHVRPHARLRVCLKPLSLTMFYLEKKKVFGKHLLSHEVMQLLSPIIILPMPRRTVFQMARFPRPQRFLKHNHSWCVHLERSSPLHLLITGLTGCCWNDRDPATPFCPFPKQTWLYTQTPKQTAQP